MHFISSYTSAIRQLTRAIAATHGDRSVVFKIHLPVTEGVAWTGMLDIQPPRQRPVRFINDDLHREIVTHADFVLDSFEGRRKAHLLSELRAARDLVDALRNGYRYEWDSLNRRKNHRAISLATAESEAMKGLACAAEDGWVGLGEWRPKDDHFLVERLIPALRENASTADPRRVMSTLIRLLLLLERKPSSLSSSATARGTLHAHLLHIGSWRAARWRRLSDLTYIERHFTLIPSALLDPALRSRHESAQQEIETWEEPRVSRIDENMHRRVAMLVRIEQGLVSTLEGYLDPYGALLLNAATALFHFCVANELPVDFKHPDLGDRTIRDLYLMSLRVDQFGHEGPMGSPEQLPDHEGYGTVAAHYAQFLAYTGDYPSALALVSVTLAWMKKMDYRLSITTLERAEAKIAAMETASSAEERKRILLSPKRPPQIQQIHAPQG